MDGERSHPLVPALVADMLAVLVVTPEDASVGRQQQSRLFYEAVLSNS